MHLSEIQVALPQVKFCECGCHTVIKNAVRFIRGHNSRDKNHHLYGRFNKDSPNFGKKRSLEARTKMRLIKLADKNPMWRGDDVSNHQLHEFIRSRLKKPALCEICHKVEPYDLANIKDIYRDLVNWGWLCRSCHMQLDYDKGIRKADNFGQVCRCGSSYVFRDARRKTSHYILQIFHCMDCKKWWSIRVEELKQSSLKDYIKLSISDSAVKANR